jgi:hypothetical protein
MRKEGARLRQTAVGQHTFLDAERQYICLSCVPTCSSRSRGLDLLRSRSGSPR